MQTLLITMYMYNMYKIDLLTSSIINFPFSLSCFRSIFVTYNGFMLLIFILEELCTCVTLLDVTSMTLVTKLVTTSVTLVITYVTLVITSVTLVTVSVLHGFD